MINLELIHKITDTEKSFLLSLLGKEICSIDSDSIVIKSGDRCIYRFHKWIRITTWNDLDSYKLEYSYDETYSADDFITLSISTRKEEERKNLNSSISFSGKNIFKVKKIELYTEKWEHESIWEGEDTKIEDILLKKNMKFCEHIHNENIIVLYDDKRRILIKCQYSYLELMIIENEDYINKFLKENGNAPEVLI